MLPLLSAHPQKGWSFIYFCLRQNTNVSSEEWETRERVKGVGGGEAGVGAFLPSENPFSYFQSLLFHARQRGAGHVLGPHRPGQAALLQHKVVVGSGVHGVENVGVVRDPELCRMRRSKMKSGKIHRVEEK